MQWKIVTDPLTESNCYLLEEEENCVVIDPNLPLVAEVLEETKWNPELLLLTHEHCDHMAGLDTLRGKWPQALFRATAACNAGIQNKRINMSQIMEVYLHFSGKPGHTYPPFVCRPADEIIPDRAEFSWRGHTFRYEPLPGHTPGSSGIFLDETIFFSGDYLLPDRDVVLRLPGGNEEEYEKVTKPFLRALPVGLSICPGHGERYFLDRAIGEEDLVRFSIRAQDSIRENTEK